MLTPYQIQVLKSQFAKEEQIYVTSLEDARQFAKSAKLTDETACIIENKTSNLFFVEIESEISIHKSEIKHPITE